MKNRILIVDDVLFMRVTLRKMLERLGYRVVGEATDGVHAIEKYKSLKPDMVLLDITMPIMDGVDCLQAIKKIDNNAKIIMVSAMGQGSFIKECFKYGAEYFIGKPFKEDKLKLVLNKLLPLPETETKPEGEQSAYQEALKAIKGQ